MKYIWIPKYGALICLLGGVVEQKKALSNIDWNILIWLACSIGMTMRVGYRFREYIKYGVSIQGILTALTIVLTMILYRF
ncbi:MAG: hypothetical protein J5684_07325 [Eubacterium sp.]|nr:hypothetical protein [Eubacterium sp.]